MQCCCFNLFDEIGNKVFTWWLSWVFLCGILACCISGFFTANRYGFSLYAIQCAYERIYYDSMYGQLKNTFPKWEGFNEINTVYEKLNNVYNYIKSKGISKDIMELYNSATDVFDKNKEGMNENDLKKISNYFYYPAQKVFVNKILDIFNNKAINIDTLKDSMKYLNNNIYLE